MNVSQNKCARCGHEWISKQAWPERCAGCKKKFWWRPARVSTPKVKRSCDRPGRPSTYPFDQLEVGESYLVAWFADKHGRPDSVRNYNITRAVIRLEEKGEKKFRRQPTSRGLLVTRLA